MMKSEEPMSKKDVKRRLDSLFGEYSALVVKPNNQQELSSNRNGAESEELPQNDSNEFINEHAPSLEEVEQQHQIINRDLPIKQIKQSPIGSIMGQIVVARPLSPVNSIYAINSEKIESIDKPVKMKQEDSPKNLPSSNNDDIRTMDLDKIIEQFSIVSPLLSPIKFAISSSALEEAGPTDQIQRKRPNEDTSKGENGIKSKSIKIQTEDNLRYSIKFDDRIFEKLLNKLNRAAMNDQNIKKSTVEKTPSKTISISNHSAVRLFPANEAARNLDNMTLLKTSKTMGKSYTKIKLTLPIKKSPTDYFPNRARETRKRAEQEHDYVRQILLYFESIAYYIMSSSTLASKPDLMYSSITDNYNFLNSTWTNFKRKVVESGQFSSIRVRIKYLQMMVSACLAYQLYSIRSSQAFNTYAVITQYEKENPHGNKRPGSRTNGNESGSSNTNGGIATCTTTPSPAASTPNSFNSQLTVTLPFDIYNSMSQQIRTFNHLMWSFKMWNEVKRYSTECKEFMGKINQICGELRQDSDLTDVAEYLLNAIIMLREEYDKVNDNRAL